MRTYTNPVYHRNFPDPFVLRHRGRYYAYATGTADDGRRFPQLSSPDLVTWEEHGGALEPLDLPGAEDYWAPEVAYSEGNFYLYYATGRSDDPDHHLRVAVAEHPLGPWQDRGRNLTPHEIFAIDAHPFRDPADGQWYLFYAQDLLAGPYAGTGLVVDRLVEMDRLEGNARRVLRPYAPWQVFELKRAVKKDLDWYTVEGPFTLRVDGRYVCFYSGGRWENPNYGVGYAFADHPLGPWEDPANAEGPQVLTTVPDRVIGPGHNSIVVGPDLRTQYLVYHGWDPGCTARLPRIDPLLWTPQGPRCDGPSWEPRPAPPAADLFERLDEAMPGPAWEQQGAWSSTEEGLSPEAAGARLTLSTPESDLVLETSVRLSGTGGSAEVRLGEQTVTLNRSALRVGERSVPLPPGFRPDAWHHLFIVRAGGRLTATLDEFPTLEVPCPAAAAPLSLAGSPGVHFSHFALSRIP